MRDKEIWKDVIGHEGRYLVSNMGRVKSLFLKGIRRNKILKNRTSFMGVLGIGIKKKFMKVHRLVAEAFIPNPKNLPYVDHKNGDNQDNRVSNLRWCTQSQNLQNRVKWKNKLSSVYKGVHRTTRGRIKTWRAVVGIRTIGYYNTERDAASAYNAEALKKYGEFAKLNIIN